MRGEDVKKRILESGLTLKEVADSMHIIPQTLQSLLGSQDIKTGVLEKIAASINKNVYFFYDTIPSPTINEGNDESSQNISMPREVFDQLSKMTETILAQQKTIDTLSRSVESLSKQKESATERYPVAAIAAGE